MNEKVLTSVRYYKGKRADSSSEHSLVYCEPTDPFLTGVELRMNLRCIVFNRNDNQDLDDFHREVDTLCSFIEEAHQLGVKSVGDTVRKVLGFK